MMEAPGKKVIIAVFYSSTECTFKDVDSQIFTEDKDTFHFFLFHNKELHFSKPVILKRVLMEYFQPVEPEFDYEIDNHALIMKKRIIDFDFIDFDKRVDVEYQDYLARITYRIECIFQTFDLFLNLYKDKNLVFVFPTQLYDKFMDNIEERKFEIEEISKINHLVRRYDILHWINYYSRKELIDIENGGIDYKNVVKILRLS